MFHFSSLFVPRLLFVLFFVATTLSACFAPSEPLPAPILLRSTPDVISLFADLDATIKSNLKDTSAPWNTSITSFAIEVSSASETLWQNYHTAPVLGNYTDGEPTNVTGETAFRIASITKIFTVLALLLQQDFGTIDLKDPVTLYLPELRDNDIDDGVRWEHISIESLASQLSGVPREYGQADLGDKIGAKFVGIADQSMAGFPPLHASDYPTCATNHETSETCFRDDIIQGSKKRPPVFPPNYKSTYSNIAFIMLGFVLETVTGKSYEEVISSTILEPLGMHHTTVKKPNDSKGIIPATYNDWRYVTGAYDPTSGIYSTSGDLSIFLRALLRSELLDESTTNAWFKPHSWSSSLHAAYGMPWEIYRTTDLLRDSDRGMTIITKIGNLYGYFSHVIMLPEYDVAITILVAGDPKARLWLENTVVTALANAVERIARHQTKMRYGGFYGSSDINSSVSLDLRGSSGLVINEWISNGTDFLHEFISLHSDDQLIEGKVQLVPAGIRRSNGAEVWSATLVPKSRQFESVIDVCMVNDVDLFMYGDRSLHEFLFLLDEHGCPTKVEIPALRINLEKTTNPGAPHGFVEL